MVKIRNMITIFFPSSWSDFERDQLRNEVFNSLSEAKETVVLVERNTKDEWNTNFVIPSKEVPKDE